MVSRYRRFRRFRGGRSRFARYARTRRRFTSRGLSTEFETQTGSLTIASGSTDTLHLVSIRSPSSSTLADEVVGGLKYTFRFQGEDTQGQQTWTGITGLLLSSEASAGSSTPNDRELRQMFAKETLIEVQNLSPLMVQRTLRGTLPLRQRDLFLAYLSLNADAQRTLHYSVEYSLRRQSALD